jgi:hypothetical protein
MTTSTHEPARFLSEVLYESATGASDTYEPRHSSPGLARRLRSRPGRHRAEITSGK